MGRMKEIFMEMVEHEYNGDHDAHLQDMARQSCEEFIKEDGTPCPNCHEPALMRNETQAACERCGQEFVYVGNALRFL